MNTDRLSELAAFLLTYDDTLGIQSELEQLRSHLDGLTGNPGDSNQQTQVVKSLARLSRLVGELEEDITPARAQVIRDIGGTPYFSAAMPAGIQTLLHENGVTPSVVRDRVANISRERSEYLSILESVQEGIESLGVGGDARSPGSAEIGFLIPRTIFNNTLEGLSSEFSQINRIIAVFSELTIGSVEPVEVHQISTTDPLIFLGIPAATIIAIGGAVTWMLDTYKKVIEIKQIHDQSKILELPDVVLEPMKAHMKQIVDDAIAEHTRQMLSRYPQEESRANELRNGLRWALESLMAKIERGMTVEIRTLPPPPPADDDEEPTAEAKVFSEIKDISHKLEFPKITGDPLIYLADSRDKEDQSPPSSGTE